MKYLFISGLYPQDKISLFESLCRRFGLNVASNTFQWAVIEGLENNRVEYCVLSAPFLPSYPHNFKILKTPQSIIWYRGKIIGKTIEYRNMIGFKSCSISHNLRKGIYEWISTSEITPEDSFCIITYSVDNSFINAVKPIKKDYPKLIVASIVTDLIDEFFNPVYKRSFLKSIQGKIKTHAIHNIYKNIDKFILLTKDMEEKIPESINNNIVIEGIHLGECQQPEKKTSKERILLYTGALASHSCINELVDAFMLTDNPVFRLFICGDGDLSNYVIQKSAIDNRIIYKGRVQREEALDYQKKATAVINPRKPTVSLTKYSFPSKTMEYLASGTPMIGYRLRGIPEEYYNYFYTVDGVDNESLASTITDVLMKSNEELEAKASAASHFIESYKNSYYQVKKIIDFLES